MGYRIRKAISDDEQRICELFIEMLKTIYHTEDVEGYESGYLDRYWTNGEDVLFVAEDELPSPTTSEMVSTIPKQYSKARSQCHYSVGKNPSAYLQMLLDALVAPGTNTLYILRATGS